MPDRTGRFIAFEGIEGSGKSTQIRLAAAALSRAGFRVETTAEPGATTLGRGIRELVMHQPEASPTPLAELYLYLADRAQHVRESLRPALDSGSVVLCDRFSASTLAYQGYGRGLDLERVREADAWARDGIRPDLTILLDCPVPTGLGRARGSDRFHSEEEAFHQRVREGFLRLASLDPTSWRVIDATQSADAVHGAALAAIEQHLSRP